MKNISIQDLKEVEAFINLIKRLNSSELLILLEMIEKVKGSHFVGVCDCQ